MLLALAGLVQFFECAVVAEPPDCAAAAPGVRDHWLVDAAFYLWLQASREKGGGERGCVGEGSARPSHCLRTSPIKPPQCAWL